MIYPFDRFLAFLSVSLLFLHFLSLPSTPLFRTVAASYSLACECCPAASGFQQNNCAVVPSFEGFALRGTAQCSGDPAKDSGYATKVCQTQYSNCASQGVLGGCIASQSMLGTDEVKVSANSDALSLHNSYSDKSLEGFSLTPPTPTSNLICSCFCLNQLNYTFIGSQMPQAKYVDPNGLLDCFSPCIPSFAHAKCPGTNSVGILQDSTTQVSLCSKPNQAMMTSGSLANSTLTQIDCVNGVFTVTDTADANINTKFTVMVTLQPSQVAQARAFLLDCYGDSGGIFIQSNQQLVGSYAISIQAFHPSFLIGPIQIFRASSTGKYICGDVLVEYGFNCPRSSSQLIVGAIEFPYVPC